MTRDSTSTTTSPAPPSAARHRLWQTVRRDLGRLAYTGVPHVFVALLSSQGIAVVQRVLLARILSVSDLGIMAYAMSILSFLTMVADIGVSTAVLKYAAERVPDEMRRSIYATGFLISGVCSLVISAVYMAAVAVLTFAGGHDLKVFMLISGPYILLSSLAKLPLLYMQALREMKRASRLTVITRVIGLVLTLVATIVWGLWGFFLTLSVAPLANLLILLLATRVHLVRARPAFALFGRLVRFGTFSMLANATGVANVAVAVVLLRHLRGSDAEVGLYAIAFTVMSGFRLLPDALMQVAFPYLSQFIHEPERLWRFNSELSRKQVAFMLGLLLIWFLVGAQMIVLVFGADKRLSYWPSLILMAGLIPFSASAPFSRTMIILDRVVLNLGVAAAQLVANVVACLMLIPALGVAGAATGVSLAQLIGSLLAIVVTRRAFVSPLGPSPTPEVLES